MTHPSLQAPFTWQQPLWQHLLGLHEQGTLPHAILLSGSVGLGKQALALAFIQRLFCESPVGDHACGECKQCCWIKAGSHPDFSELMPEEVGKAIKVDQVRTVVGFLQQTSQQSGKKVILITPAEAMNTNASNALLKSLEEPAGDSLLLLLSHQPSRLLPTIRSRCQHLVIKPPTQAQFSEWLLAQGQDGAVVDQLLASGELMPMKALTMLEGDTLNLNQQRTEAFDALLQGKKSAFSLAESWQADFLEVLEWLLACLAQQILGLVESERLSEAAPYYQVRDQVNAMRSEFLAGSNVNKQLALEVILLACCEKLAVSAQQ